MQSDPYFAKFSALLAARQLNTTKYKEVGGLFYYKTRLMLPPNCSLKTKFLSDHHDSPTAGHSGFLKCYHRLKRVVNWPGLKADFEILYLRMPSVSTEQVYCSISCTLYFNHSLFLTTFGKISVWTLSRAFLKVKERLQSW